MTDRLDFEARLEDRLRARAAIASRPFDAAAIAHQAALAGGRRRFGRSLRLADRPALRWALLAVLALGLLAGGIVAASLLLDRSSPLAGRWTPTGPMQDMRDHDRAPSAMLLDGRVLFVGGAQDSEVASSELFDPRTNTFSRTAGVMAEPRRGHSATTLRDGRVLVAGGNRPGSGAGPLDTAELFDPATGTFSPTGRMVSGSEAHVAVLLADGRVLVIGAFEPNSDLAQIFDPVSGSWSSAGRMVHSRFALAATLLPDGRVFVSGGMDSMATTELFDPSTGRFTPGPSMANPRYGHTSVGLADGRVLLIGGTDGNRAMASVEVYDPATGRIATTGSLVTERSYPAAVLLSDGRVMVAGGSLVNDGPLSAELYDPTTGTFQQAAFAARMHLGVAHQLRDGRVLVTGDQPELFDPSATTSVAPVRPASVGPFIATGDLTEDRVGHTATRLPDGRVLIIGGVSPDVWRAGTDELTSAEIYDPKAGSFAPTGAMHVSRVPDAEDTLFGHVALLLRDGRVLVMGDRRHSWDAQIFDPATGAFSHLGSLGPEEVTVGQPIAAVQLSDARILLFGPPLDRSSTIESDSLAYELDLGQPRATKIADLPGCHGVDEALALADGRVVLRCAYGGENEARVFDPDTGRSSILDVPSRERRSMVLLADGRVLFTCGKETTSLTLFDPMIGRTAASGSLPALAIDDNRSNGPSLTVLKDRRVLMIGGRDALLWDPNTAIASTLPAPLAIRDGHTATRLDDGRVLVVGGTRWPEDRGVARPPGAELFDPSALP